MVQMHRLKEKRRERLQNRRIDTTRFDKTRRRWKQMDYDEEYEDYDDEEEDKYDDDEEDKW
ncbi:MAG: hypothetical protein KKF44_09025 [Nanoarchaeota archaeon]|nr:hypothetical protein [Nanoarchaeota archaeon]